MAFHVSINFQIFTTVITKYVDCEKLRKLIFPFIVKKWVKKFHNRDYKIRNLNFHAHAELTTQQYAHLVEDKTS